SEESKEMFASPVNAQETQVTTVENNGSAMAAYMMCAGLWVAALAFCILTGVEKDPMRIRKDRKRWVRKVSEVLIFAVGSGALLVGLLVAINGFNPAYLGRTVALSIMTSLAFTCIVYFFNILLGKIGSFLLLVILVIQLGCAGGTYPLDLSPQIYSSLNPFFPFSYAVDGFRRTIATGQDITHIMLVLGAFALVFAILSAITLTIKIKSKKEKEYSMSQLLEEAFD
ncbi:MAG: YhgE/Pip family protein, partial [Ruminococcus sp.]